ncbi:MAG: glycosyltransferase family 2 protein [Candidatus Brocadiaceae bacterium]|nr:glycosyltransferase family 2 protein [Candidatus Brocadiaceae bacterium]
MDKVLVIIPAYNEKKSIGGVVRDVKTSLPEADVLVINDGSTDDTSGEARQYGAMVLELPCNMGLGVAVQSGLIFAQDRGYRFVARMDGDGQHRPTELRSLLAPLEKGEADMVVGSRFLKAVSVSELNEYKPSLARRIGIGLFSGLLSFLLGTRVTDPNSGLHAMNHKSISFFAKEYPPDYPEVEVRVMAHKAGLVIREIPSTMLHRTGGASSITSLKSVYIVLEMLTSTIVGMFRRTER